VQNTGGERFVIAIDWTDINANKVGEPQSPTHLLDYQGLLQALELIECIHQGKNIRTCRFVEGDYDELHQPQVEQSSEEQS
jgi:hypothetical protein